MAPAWVWSALHVTDVSTSCAFYQKLFDCAVLYRGQEIAIAEGPAREVCFLATPLNCPSTKGAENAPAAVRDFEGQCLALVHAPDKVLDGVNSGNVQPHRGFGHIAFNCADVYAACEKFDALGVRFKKRPDEGRMKGIAFILDPDGYWVELVPRNKEHPFERPFNFSQTMIRVKSAEASLGFYTEVLGLKLGHKMTMSDFTNYFLSSMEENCTPFTNWWPVLELTHNHEFSDPGDGYHTGRTPPYGFIGLAFSCADGRELESCLDRAQAKGCEIRRTHSHSSDCAECTNQEQQQQPQTLASATIYDPDGYKVKIFVR